MAYRCWIDNIATFTATHFSIRQIQNFWQMFYDSTVTYVIFLRLFNQNGLGLGLGLELGLG